MAKRHTKQNNKQALGQYFTTNASDILEGYEHLVKNKTVIDPFAGGGDLLNWAINSGARSTIGYDIEPKSSEIIKNDSLVNPPSYENCFLVTNPPYLSANKCRNGDRQPYDIWGASDYYKCHLASLVNGCDEAIEIIPANFFCESRMSARQRLFKTHHIVSAKLWNQPVFEDTTTGIAVLHIKRGAKPKQNFPLTILPKNIVVDMELEERYNYLNGGEFFDYIGGSELITVVKVEVDDESPNTNLVIGLLDKGARPVGLSYNHGDPIYCQPKSFTTYQISLPDYDLTTDQQHQIVELFTTKLKYYRDLYHSLFLANYMGPEQKILSRDYVHKLLSRVINDLGILPRKMSNLFEI